MIDWNKTNREDVLLINQIARAACRLDISLSLLDVQMDLEACHTHGCPLDLAAMAKASDYDLMHDVAGIGRFLDRDTGELRDGFLPRFAATMAV